jgi:hypothetical protein
MMGSVMAFSLQPAAGVGVNAHQAEEQNPDREID